MERVHLRNTHTRWSIVYAPWMKVIQTWVFRRCTLPTIIIIIMFFITIVDKRNNRRVQYNSKNQLQHAGLRITKHNIQGRSLWAPHWAATSTIIRTSARLYQQESSATLTNQRVSYAFTSSPFTFHARHILPTSKFQYSYSCILLIFYRRQWTVSLNRVHWFDASVCSVTPVNNSITLKSPVQSLGYTVHCAALQISVQFSPKARTPTIRCRARNIF